jgi:hypothetical protein
MGGALNVGDLHPATGFAEGLQDGTHLRRIACATV